MTELLTAIGALVALFAGVATAIWRARTTGRAQGRAQANTEAMRDAQERTERGRQAVQTGRASGGTPDERLRRNDGRWN